MSTEPVDIEEWERQRRHALGGLAEALDAGDIDLDVDPLRFLAVLDRFVSDQDYHTLDKDDWLWLHTALAAYVAQVLIVRHGARWALVTDAHGPNYVLMITGLDGLEHAVSPMDVVYDDFQRLPPAVARMLATAETTAGVVPDLEA